MRALILGEQPSAAGLRALTVRGHSPASHFPLSGAVGKRLATLASLIPDAEGTPYGRFYWPLRAAFDLDNVFDDDRPWSAPEAAERARERVREHPDCCKVVALGRRVGDAIGHQGEWFTIALLPWCGKIAYLLPHPSGRNRLLNDQGNLRLMSSVLTELACRA